MQIKKEDLKIVFILAGSIQEYRNQMTEVLSMLEHEEIQKGVKIFKSRNRVVIKDTFYIYVSGPKILHPFEKFEIIYCGSWEKRSDVKEIEKVLTEKGITSLKFKDSLGEICK